ncbi:MAG: ABC transporter permease [Acidobacteriia bacterium]|nr:ABC transporter permease [Terriglobia bacterium]
MDRVFQDLRYGWRLLRKNPGFAAVAALTLALGIGANTAMFSVINVVLLRPLPFKDPDHLMFVYQTMANGNPNVFSTPAYLEWKQQQGPLADMAALSPVQLNLSGGALPERVTGARVSQNLFPVVGAEPLLGRNFAVDEDRPGSGRTIILSHALWKTRFDSRADLLGSPITLNGAPYTVVGVMPPGFHVLNDNELFWVPLQLETVNAQTSARNIHWLYALARLPQGADQAQADAVLKAIAARLKAQDPTGDGGFGIFLQSIREFLTGNVKPALLLLMGSVGFVLLIACSNVANLLLARGTARQREMSIRTAMGAMRIRVVRQLLTESLLLALIGGVLGLGLAYGAIAVLRALRPPSIPQIASVAIDGQVLGYTLLLCMVVGVVFGIVPALEASRTDVNEALKEGARGASRGFGKHRMVLVVTETALASILLIGAGLSLKSLWVAAKVDPGFDPSGVLTFRMAAPTGLPVEQIPLFYQQVLDKVRALPGVQSAVLARNLPMSGGDPSMPIAIEGTPPPPSQTPVVSRFRSIGPGYFHGLQTAMLRGREFDENDSKAAPSVAIVSQSLAHLYWPNEDPIGKRLKPEMPGGQWCTVVGLAADVRHWAADVDIEPTVYYPYTQVPDSYLPLLEGSMSIAVRSSGSQAGLLSEIRSVVAEVNKGVPVSDVKTMDEMVEDSGSLRRFDMWLIGTFAVLALALAGIGIYGVMAYSVSQRTREIGIRIALGAQQESVLRLIVGQGAKLAGTGVVVGLLGAFALTRVMASLLYGVSPTDCWTFVIVPLLVLFFIVLACYVPARRAARVDPIIALRYE